MFGKPNWFRAKRIGWGLIPIRWQGWVYSAGWVGAIGLPFVLLMLRHQPLEATAWLGLAVSTLTYDVWQILRALNAPATSRPADAGVATVRRDEGVLYILDSQRVRGGRTSETGGSKAKLLTASRGGVLR